MKPDEEIMVEIESGKNLLIRFRYMGEPNEEGYREVFFQINGQTRNILVKDENVKVAKVLHAKATAPNDVGAPLQGKLVEITVAEGDEVKKGQPLFVIEAMKMETTVSSHMDGIVQRVMIPNNTMVEQDDCVIELK
jgi:pyruvate carboxylase